MPNFSSLEYTFIEQLFLTTTPGRESLTVLGSGPYIYVSVKDLDASDTIPFNLGLRLTVFEATGTYVRGVQNLWNGFVLVWGDSYLAHIPDEQLMKGGTVCPQNIFSTGRQIITITAQPNLSTVLFASTHTLFTTFYADGTVENIYSYQNMGRKHPTISPRNILRLPLKPTEKVTAAYTKGTKTYLGTSHGRLIAVKDLVMIFIREPVINNPVKQIVRTSWPNCAANATLLLFENGSILAWKDMNIWAEIKGRYTSIALFTWEMRTRDENIGDNYILAGDMDGNLAAFRIKPGQIEPYRTIRNFTLNEITTIEVVYNDVLITTKMGELQWFTTRQLDKNGHPDDPPPNGVIDSPCSYRTTDGWYFLKDDKLWKVFKCMVADSKDPVKPMEKYFEMKNIKLKYLCCTGHPDREIVFAYSRHGYFTRVTEYSKNNDSVEYSGEHHTEEPIVIIQVILMQSYILIQLDSGIVQLFSIEGMIKTNKMEPCLHFQITGRITAAAIIQKIIVDEKSLYLVVAYRDGRIEMAQAERNGLMINNPYFSPISVDLQGSYIASMIYSQSLIGSMQNILLSKKGIVYLVLFPATQPYLTVHQQDLSSIIGRGHSLIETALGILVVGFKQNTLHVCWITSSISKPFQYRHLFSVDTRSSRLPFTVMEDNVTVPGAPFSSGLAVSYHHKDGYKEDRFPFLLIPTISSFKHSEIITNCLFPGMKDRNGNDLICTGDTKGRFCIWSIDKQNVSEQYYINDFKLNGAVTGIRKIDDFFAVATSQGDLHLYKIFIRNPFTIFPLIPYNIGQKISYITRVEISSQAFLLVFLGDGTVQQIKLEKYGADKHTVADYIKVKKVAKFAVPTKMAFCKKHEKDYYITALGNDGILRRTQLSAAGNITVEISWKMSVIKDIDIFGLKVLLVGDPNGRVYLLMTDSTNHNNFYSDRLHSHEIIDVLFHTPDTKEYLFCSLDISGTVAIRRMTIGEKSEGPAVFWSCPVPSPRKIEIIGERQIMVFGRGVATRSF